MRHWQAKVDLKQEWKQAQDDELTAHELAQAVARKVRAAVPPGLFDFALKGILQDFREMPEDADFDDFDDVLHRLYNWADYDKRLWVGTF